jgi:2-(1,2-epoxy-1,2-dihydrophenyl)acetyl-CoA isomerase
MHTLDDVRTVSLETRDNVAVLTLNRPDAQNTINFELARDLDIATSSIPEDCGALLITSAGRTFCAGGDLKEFGSQADLPAHLAKVIAHLHPAIERIESLEMPVVAAVRGSAAGAGLGLACAADIVLATHDAKFVSAYTKIGLSPDGSVSYALPRLVGMRRALELVLTNRVLSAEEALDWGLITAIEPEAVLDKHAFVMASTLAAGPTKSLAGSRRLIRDSLGATLSQQLHDELSTMIASASDADGPEGIAAFVEKRPPDYR